MTDQPIPIIFDTDIGGDIDDLYALYVALFHPRIKLLAVTTAFMDTQAKARLVAKALRLAGREDIPIGAGVGLSAAERARRRDWPPDERHVGYTRYVTEADPEHGRTYPPATQVIRETLAAADEPVSIVCVGAASNVAEAVMIPEPDLRAKIACTALMAGETHLLRPEYNVLCDPEAAEVILNCGLPCFLGTWDVTCRMALGMEDVRREFGGSDNPVFRALLECTEIWGPDRGPKDGPVLYDLGPLYWLVDPDCIRTRKATVHVELRGDYTRAMTIPTANDGPVYVSEDLDGPALAAECVRIIKAGAAAL